MFYHHSGSGLAISRTRLYDATLGRWTNRDPIQEKGGVNLYVYTADDPLGRTDTSGLLQDGATLLQLGRALGSGIPIIEGFTGIPLIPIAGAAAVGAGAGYIINKIPGVSDTVSNGFYNLFFNDQVLNGPGRRALEEDREFRRWFHRVWKPWIKKCYPGEDNPNLDDDELDEAYLQWLEEGRPRVK